MHQIKSQQSRSNRSEGKKPPNSLVNGGGSSGLLATTVANKTNTFKNSSHVVKSAERGATTAQQHDSLLKVKLVSDVKNYQQQQ